MVNTYFPGTASVSAGQSNTNISLGAGRGASTVVAVGDMLLVIQMQDATIEANNDAAYGDGVAAGTYVNGYTAIGQSGLYEYVRATSAVGVGGGSVSIVGQGANNGLVNGYLNQAGSDTLPQKRFQVVRVPQYVDATISGTVSGVVWDGTSGGIVAFDAAHTLTMSGGSVTVSGMGFRGGGGISSGAGTGANTDIRTPVSNGANGSKGEGVAGTPRYLNNNGVFLDNGVEGYPNGSRARGAPGNAGGGGTDGNPAANDQNTGGGGGGNAGRGGLGGYGWCNATGTGCAQSGGYPGAAVTQLSTTRITMGGGGGAATTNNATGSPGAGFASSGAAGGGIVMIRAGEIAGSGSFFANGADANNSVLNDGSGGGGAGGAILLSAVRTNGGAALSASANGGIGGTNNPGGSGSHGPGGGGGGGYVAASMPVSASALGGANGGTQASTNFGTAYGAESGASGTGTTVTASAIPGLSSGGECTPTVSKSFSQSPIVAGMPSVLSVLVTNNNPTLAITGMAFTDTYPSNIVNTATPNAAKTCATAATLTAAAGGPSLAVSAATINAASSCTYTVNVTGTAAGVYTNTIAAGGVVGSYSGVSVQSRAAASAGITVSPPLSVTKVSAAFSDPVNSTTNPKLIPGGFVDYTILVTNPGSVVVDNNTVVITDPTAANLNLFVGNLGGAGSGPVAFSNGTPSSTLTYTFTSLGNTTDDVEFSNDNGASWTYSPVPDANGFDAAVTTIRIRPKGSMAAGSNFSVVMRYRIN